MTCSGNAISDVPRSNALRSQSNSNASSLAAAAEFQPGEILAVLDRHGVAYVLIGGYAALLHGSTLPTTDIDITPRRDRENLTKLVAALNELDARIRVSADDEPLPFQTSPESLSTLTVLNVATKFGDLDLVVRPAGFPTGYEGLAPDATVETIAGVDVRVATLDDVIASKEAAGRDKDFIALPLLIALRNQRESGD